MISQVIQSIVRKHSGKLLWSLALCGIATPAFATCSTQSLTGSYGFIISGTVTGGPIAIVGQISTDGTGFLSGLETVSENGTILNSVETLGNYTINSDCSGSLTIQGAGLTPQNFAIALVDEGKEFTLVETDAGTTESGVAQAEGSKACSSSAINGVYALQGGGSEATTGPVALGGQVIFHGDGTLSGTATVSINGSITSAQLSGGYKVNHFCNGAISMALGGRNFIHLNVVVADEGKTIHFIRIDTATMVSGTMQN